MFSLPRVRRPEKEKDENISEKKVDVVRRKREIDCYLFFIYQSVYISFMVTADLADLASPW